MKVEIVTIGDELTTGTIQDTNFSWLAGELSLHGFDVVWNQVVRDEPEDIRAALLASVGRSRAVVVTGGLGPTTDDLTSEVAAATFGIKLLLHEESLQQIRSMLEAKGGALTESQKKMAYIPEGATVLPNEVGTAPGYFLQYQGSTFFFVPGVPREMHQQFFSGILPELHRLAGSEKKTAHRVFRCFGLMEAEMNERLKKYRFEPVRFSYRVFFPEVLLKIVAWDKDESAVQEQLNRVEKILRQELRDALYATGQDGVEVILGRLLRERQETLAVAESCTGGHVTNLLTNVPGSSAYVERGCVVYSNQAKQDLLGVKRETLAKHGSVSAEVAREMAQGVRERAKTTYGLAITGIAGPTGGTPEKPQGTVFMALATSKSVEDKVYHLPFPRDLFKQVVAHVALHKLRRRLLRNN